MMNEAARRYQTVQHSTTDRGGALVLLHDNILREMRWARETFSQEPRGGELHLLKAQMGVVELDRSLNFEAAPQLAQALHHVYVHLLWRTSLALEERDGSHLEKAEELLAPLRDAWAQASAETRTSRRAG